MSRKFLCLGFGSLLLLSSSVFAQPQGQQQPPTAAQMVAHQISHLSTLLTLTSAQQTEATKIFTEEQTATASVRTGLRTAHTALETAVETNDTAVIDKEAAAIGALTTTEVQARSTAEAAFYAILTPDQQTKYKEMMTRGPGGPGGHGPGGPGMP